MEAPEGDGGVTLSLRWYHTAPPHPYECVPPAAWNDIRGDSARAAGTAPGEEAFPHVPPQAREGRFVGERYLYNPFLHVAAPPGTAVPDTLQVCVEEWPTVEMLEGMEERYLAHTQQRV